MWLWSFSYGPVVMLEAVLVTTVPIYVIREYCSSLVTPFNRTGLCIKKLRTSITHCGRCVHQYWEAGANTRLRCTGDVSNITVTSLSQRRFASIVTPETLLGVTLSKEQALWDELVTVILKCHHHVGYIARVCWCLVSKCWCIYLR